MLRAAQKALPSCDRFTIFAKEHSIVDSIRLPVGHDRNTNRDCTGSEENALRCSPRAGVDDGTWKAVACSLSAFQGRIDDNLTKSALPSSVFARSPNEYDVHIGHRPRPPLGWLCCSTSAVRATSRPRPPSERSAIDRSIDRSSGEGVNAKERPRGASKYDVHKIFGFFIPSPLVRIWN